MIAETDANNTIVRRYVHGPAVDDPIVWFEGSGTADKRYFTTDRRGSIVGITNTAGTSLAINAYDEYGIPKAGNTGRFQYTGQTWLGEVGLYYYKARLYNPVLGRFMQTDPVGYEDDLNLYAYVGNDPLNVTDPSGLYMCSGSEENCTRVANFVSAIGAAAKTLDRNSDAYKKIDAVVKYLGKPGERNGAYITAGRIEGKAIAHAGPGGNIVVDVKKVDAVSQRLASRNPGVSAESLQNAVGAGAIGHEARHEIDGKLIGWPTSRSTSLRTEMNAYRTEQGIHKGLGLESGLWSSRMTPQQQNDAVSRGAQASTEYWCAQFTGGCGD